MNKTDVLEGSLLREINESALYLKVKCACTFGETFEFLIMMINWGNAIIIGHLECLKRKPQAQSGINPICLCKHIGMYLSTVRIKILENHFS